jgi:hypothetical protein
MHGDPPVTWQSRSAITLTATVIDERPTTAPDARGQLDEFTDPDRLMEFTLSDVARRPSSVRGVSRATRRPFPSG